MNNLVIEKELSIINTKEEIEKLMYTIDELEKLRLDLIKQRSEKYDEQFTKQFESKNEQLEYFKRCLITTALNTELSEINTIISILRQRVDEKNDFINRVTEYINSLKNQAL